MKAASVHRGIESRIRLIRGEKVLIDADLAVLYGVTTAALNQAVVRNKERFPGDFCFQLSAADAQSLISQSVISKQGRGGRRTPIRAFTEQGVSMLSSVLRSGRAVEVNIEIMRAFVRLRRVLEGNQVLAKKLAEMEKHYDGQFKVVFEAIRQLMAADEKPKPRIGF
jgi:hypothetical protein